MKTAAVSKLKAGLSEYLARVKAGEEVIVTERGKPIAKIVPFGGSQAEIPAHLLEKARAGLIRLGSGKLPKGFWKMPRPTVPGGAGVKAVLEERESGWGSSGTRRRAWGSSLGDLPTLPCETSQKKTD